MAISSSYNDPTDMTVDDYIRGCVGYDLTNEAIARILMDNGVAPKSAACMLDEKQKDLLKISTYELVLASPAMSKSIHDANGSWQHKEGATQRNTAETDWLRKELRRLKRKWGMKVESSIKLHVGGMRVWRECR